MWVSTRQKYVPNLIGGNLARKRSDLVSANQIVGEAHTRFSIAIPPYTSFVRFRPRSTVLLILPNVEFTFYIISSDTWCKTCGGATLNPFW